MDYSTETLHAIQQRLSQFREVLASPISSPVKAKEVSPEIKINNCNHCPHCVNSPERKCRKASILESDDEPKAVKNNKHRKTKNVKSTPKSKILSRAELISKYGLSPSSEDTEAPKKKKWRKPSPARALIFASSSDTLTDSELSDESDSSIPCKHSKNLAKNVNKKCRKQSKKSRKYETSESDSETDYTESDSSESSDSYDSSEDDYNETEIEESSTESESDSFEEEEEEKPKRHHKKSHHKSHKSHHKAKKHHFSDETSDDDSDTETTDSESDYCPMHSSMCLGHCARCGSPVSSPQSRRRMLQAYLEQRREQAAAAAEEEKRERENERKLKKLEKKQKSLKKAQKKNAKAIRHLSPAKPSPKAKLSPKAKPAAKACCRLAMSPKRPMVFTAFSDSESYVSAATESTAFSDSESYEQEAEMKRLLGIANHLNKYGSAIKEMLDSGYSPVASPKRSRKY